MLWRLNSIICMKVISIWVSDIAYNYHAGLTVANMFCFISVWSYFFLAGIRISKQLIDSVFSILIDNHCWCLFISWRTWALMRCCNSSKSYFKMCLEVYLKKTRLDLLPQCRQKHYCANLYCCIISTIQWLAAY